MARPSTMPTQPVAPCTTRSAISASTEGAKAAATQASAKQLNPIRSTGRRPNRSESGPMTICEMAMEARNSDSISCTWL